MPDNFADDPTRPLNQILPKFQVTKKNEYTKSVVVEDVTKSDDKKRIEYRGMLTTRSDRNHQSGLKSVLVKRRDRGYVMVPIEDIITMTRHTETRTNEPKKSLEDRVKEVEELKAKKLGALVRRKEKTKKKKKKGGKEMKMFDDGERKKKKTDEDGDPIEEESSSDSDDDEVRSKKSAASEARSLELDFEERPCVDVDKAREKESDDDKDEQENDKKVPALDDESGFGSDDNDDDDNSSLDDDARDVISKSIEEFLANQILRGKVYAYNKIKQKYEEEFKVQLRGDYLQVFEEVCREKCIVSEGSNPTIKLKS
eukprot:TRINITY_DN7382_c0_g1_i2.p1 TRINITY_DN7382_c0_g1~~TRINITY_DN7382_c0_g1_i2.p1  ORF type:complete len:313 (-),score=105.98 TRINITY_DN7382_c0_g1_i2:57-995(-)